MSRIFFTWFKKEKKNAPTKQQRLGFRISQLPEGGSTLQRLHLTSESRPGERVHKRFPKDWTRSSFCDCFLFTVSLCCLAWPRTPGNPPASASRHAPPHSKGKGTSSETSVVGRGGPAIPTDLATQPALSLRTHTGEKLHAHTHRVPAATPSGRATASGWSSGRGCAMHQRADAEGEPPPPSPRPSAGADGRLPVVSAAPPLRRPRQKDRREFQPRKKARVGSTPLILASGFEAGQGCTVESCLKTKRKGVKTREGTALTNNKADLTCSINRNEVVAKKCFNGNVKSSSFYNCEWTLVTEAHV